MKTIASLESTLDRRADRYDEFLEQIRRHFAGVVNGDVPLFTTNATGLFDAFLANLPDEARQHYTCHACFATARQAAQAMQALNGHARERDGHNIYPLKSKLVKLFYERGYCKQLKLQEQVLRCNSRWHWYSETLEDDNECPKCGGTGIYKTHLLFLFTFDIDGKSFEWHQPCALTPWLSTGQAEIGGAYDSKNAGHVIDNVKAQAILMARVYMFLWRNGAKPIFKRPGLATSLRMDWRKHELHQRVLHAKRHLMAAIKNQEVADDEDPPIPF